MGCAKKSYLKWDHASNDADALDMKFSKPFEVYHCRACGAFHVGSAKRRKSRPRERRSRKDKGDDASEKHRRLIVHPLDAL